MAEQNLKNLPLDLQMAPNVDICLKAHGKGECRHENYSFYGKSRKPSHVCGILSTQTPLRAVRLLNIIFLFCFVVLLIVIVSKFKCLNSMRRNRSCRGRQFERMTGI